MSNKNSRSRSGNWKKYGKGGKPSSKSLNKNNSTRNQRRDSEIVGTALKAEESSSNPVEFYTKFAAYAKDAATLPFSLPLGVLYEESYNFDLNSQGQGGPFTLKEYTPGLMSIVFVPTIGISNDFTSPVNQTSIKFWTYLRSIQKAAASYDHQDITMMVIAIDNALMFHANMRRAYKLLGEYTPTNLYYPKALVAAAGFDYNDLKENIADFRMYINQFAYNLQQYALPDGIELFNRHQWMCEGIYVDSQSARAQTYEFVPQGFYKYDNTVATGSKLTLQTWLNPTVPTTHTFAEVKQFGDALINAISNDEDFAFISGDIYNFTGGKTYKVPYLEEQEILLPLYDETVLSQIENAYIVGPVVNTDITQDPSVNNGAILYQPQAQIADSVFPLQAKMNFHHDAPTSDQVLEATRFIPCIGVTSDPGRLPYGQITSCGSELITAIQTWGVNPATGAFRFNQLNDSTQDIHNDMDPTDWRSVIGDLLLLANFDWAPRLDIVLMSGETRPYTWTWMGTSWDVDNMQIVDYRYVEQIQRAALMSLLVVGSGY